MNLQARNDHGIQAAICGLSAGHRAVSERHFHGGQALWPPAGGHALQHSGRRQAHPPGADPGVCPAGGHRLAPGSALCLRPGAGTQLFPDPRRSALHGRRRPAPGPAHHPQEVRRDPGGAGRRRFAAGGLPADRGGSLYVRRQPCGGGAGAGPGLRRRRHGGRSGAGHPVRHPDGGAAEGHVPAENRGDDLRRGGAWLRGGGYARRHAGPGGGICRPAGPGLPDPGRYAGRGRR